MRLKPTTKRTCRRILDRQGSVRAFTLAEVLAALLFMAIVIPTAVHGVRIASMAGQVAQRKSSAIRIAEQVLNEVVVTGTWKSSVQTGSIQEGPCTYQWNLRLDPWNDSTMRELTVQVLFPVQGRDYDVRLSTLIDIATQ